MPFCPNCGHECQERSKFYSTCGQRIEGKSVVSIELPQASIEESIIWEGKPAGLKARVKNQAI